METMTSFFIGENKHGESNTQRADSTLQKSFWFHSQSVGLAVQLNPPDQHKTMKIRIYIYIYIYINKDIYIYIHTLYKFSKDKIFTYTIINVRQFVYYSSDVSGRPR